MSEIGSRDLSEIIEKELKVTIEGIGTLKTGVCQLPLADHVGSVQTFLTGETARIENPAHAPWQIVAFDRTAHHITVRPVK